MASSAGAKREGARWIGRTIAHRYRVEEHIARGGMGDVFLAIQEPLGRQVALKTFRTLGELDGHADAGALFLREAAAIAGVRHENAVEVYDYGTHEGTPFLVMEWIDGVSLARTLEREGCLSPRRALRIAEKVLAALGTAHELGMVHRDIKPENIMLRRNGQGVKLVDFGLVKWDRQGSDAYAVDGVVVGSPRYMAPEQILDARSVDHRADLYGVGGVLVHMLTGAPPFSGSNVDLFRQHVRSTPPALRARALDASDALEDAVERCLAKSPDDRFATAEALLAALRGCPEWQGQATGTFARESDRPPPRRVRPRPRAPRIGLALACLIAAFYVGLWVTAPAKRDAESVRSDVPPVARPEPIASPEPPPRPAAVAPAPMAAEPTEVAPPPVSLSTVAPHRPSRRRHRRAKNAEAGPPPEAPLPEWAETIPCDPIKDPWADATADELGPWTKAHRWPR